MMPPLFSVEHRKVLGVQCCQWFQTFFFVISGFLSLEDQFILSQTCTNYTHWFTERLAVCGVEWNLNIANNKAGFSKFGGVVACTRACMCVCMCVCWFDQCGRLGPHVQRVILAFGIVAQQALCRLWSVCLFFSFFFWFFFLLKWMYTHNLSSNYWGRPFTPIVLSLDTRCLGCRFSGKEHSLSSPFLLPFCVVGSSALRSVFLKTDNHINGRFLAELTHQVFDDLESQVQWQCL